MALVVTPPLARTGFHTFRHTFASRLAQEGISIYKISKFLGHSSVLVTQIYAHFSPGYDEDIEKLTLVSKENPPSQPAEVVQIPFQQSV